MSLPFRLYPAAVRLRSTRRSAPTAAILRGSLCSFGVRDPDTVTVRGRVRPDPPPKRYPTPPVTTRQSVISRVTPFSSTCPTGSTGGGFGTRSST